MRLVTVLLALFRTRADETKDDVLTFDACIDSQVAAEKRWTPARALVGARVFHALLARLDDDTPPCLLFAIVGLLTRLMTIADDDEALVRLSTEGRRTYI